MADSWRPENGSGSGPSNHRRHHDQRGRDPYAPADRYPRNHSPPPRVHMDQYYAPRRERERESGYSFRGAAQSADFSFRAPNDPYAPVFPNAPPPQRAPPSRPKRSGPKHANNNNHKGRGDHNQGRGGWRKPKPAHNRAILQTDRETTPEQLIGMANDSQPKFADVTSSSEDGSDDDSEVEQGEDGPSRKHVKSEAAIPEPAEPARPKWSNPDPYSAAPPTDLGLQPKKDIVQSIRKAKIAAAQQTSSTNAIKENADFISFDMSDDAKSEQSDESSEGDDDDFVGAPLALDDIPPPPPPDIPPPPPPDDFIMPTDEEVMANYVGGKKRKRGPEQTQFLSAGHIVTDWLPDQSDPTPWVKGKNYDFTANGGLHRLHMEILDFHDYVLPRGYEQKCRNDVIERVQNVVRGFVGGGTGVRVEAFGSFASGLYLPTADLDLVAVSYEYMNRGHKLFCQTKSKMFVLANRFERSTAKNNRVEVIAKAKVPIIKFTDDKTNLKVDISFENNTGLDTIPTLVGWKTQYPQMPVLVSIIKQFLAMRGLNEVFSGGIGGFTIICLVVSMLQLKPELQGKQNNVGYGELLQDFFDLYGNKFDIKSTGIRMDPPGYFRKGVDRVSVKFNPNTLTIIDPNRPDNDISGGSRKIEAVFECFRGAHSLIQRQLDQIRNGNSPSRSILGCILGGNYSSFEVQRDLLHRVDRQIQESHQGYQQPFARPPPPPMQYYNSYAPPPPPGSNRAPTYHDYQGYSSRPQQYPPPPHSLPARPPPPARGYGPFDGSTTGGDWSRKPSVLDRLNENRAAPQPDEAASRAKKPKKAKAKNKTGPPVASSSKVAGQRQPTLSTGAGPSKIEKKKQKKKNKAEKRKNAAKGDTAAHAS